MQEILTQVRERVPLTHCITNRVTINDCANVLLAGGATPTMAGAEQEVEEIVSIADALVLNLGNLHDSAIRAMRRAGRRANELGIPVVLDPVGVGASQYRAQAAHQLMEEIHFAVIRGNASEIRVAGGGIGAARGVDASAQDAVTADSLERDIAFMRAFSARSGAVIAVSGVTDLVSDDRRTALIRGGHPMLSRVTGTGCMLSAMTGAFCGAAPDRIFEAAAAACAAMDVAGERAFAKTQAVQGGTGSFRMYLVNEISLMNETILAGGMNIEIRYA